MANKNKIIFLCTGNICRSPIGEALLKHAIDALPEGDPLKSFEVVSAGTSTIDGMPPSANSVSVMERSGIDISQYRSTALTQKLLDECFALFAMDASHIDVLKRAYSPNNARILRVLENSPIGGRKNVPDPYGGDMSEYLEVRDDIMSAIPSIINYLRNELKNA